MNPHDQEKLLKEILPPDDLADFRQASLAFGLAGLHREQRRRHVVRFIAAGTVLICLSLGLVMKSRKTGGNQTAQIHPALATASAIVASHVDFINDDQLLALFTNQPVALIGKPGEQRLVFLGESQNHSAPHQY
jgi:peptidoglycan/LPS O-acetylase OafA/YrhL